MFRSLLCGQTKNLYLFNNVNCLRENKVYKQWKNVKGKISYRQFSLNKKTETEKKYLPFTDLIKFRREEAKRSVIVQVQSANSYKELYTYCNQLGTVKRMFHYTSGIESMHFILVEFSTEEDVLNVMQKSCHIDDSQAVPVNSPFLWFRISSNKKSSTKSPKNYKLDLENGTKLPSDETITELLRNSNNVSDQMRVIYELTKLNDLGIRLRFLTARQIELAIVGMFPDAVAYPFGSSINGYGKLGCDLDLVLKLNQNNKVNNDSRLVYQCKAGLGNERSQSQRHMEAVGDLLHLFLPGCSQVRRILQARVPILKYNQQFTDIECDLSMTNMTALHMSEILYLYGSIDDRVRPLVFTVRKWAQEVGLTNSSPGRWITNFSLTLLVLAFLQQTPLSSPILPSLNSLVKLGGRSKTRNEDEIGYLFFDDIVQLKNENNNSESLENLLLHFFEYYSNFDFVTKAISLNESTVITKPEHSPLYIVNPLERALNVSKNVSLEELERLRIELRNAAWSLESQDKKIGNWGILSIFGTAKQKKFFVAKHNRIMEVKKLFEEEIIGDGDNLTTLQPIEYKNDAVKKQVEEIKLESDKRVKQLTRQAKVRTRASSAKRT